MLMSSALKIGMHAGAMLAEYIAYTAPNPSPRGEETTKYDRKPAVSRFVVTVQHFTVPFAWSFHLCEVAALIAQAAVAPSFASKVILSSLVAFPASANRLQAIPPVFVVGFTMLILGAAIRKWCYVTLGRHFTFQLVVFKDHKLSTSGPYAFVRHPAYSGLILAFVGMLLLELAPGGWLRESGLLHTLGGRMAFGTWLLSAIFTVLSVVRRARQEDDVLREEFGERWREWAKKTPYVLVPYVY
ncbi:hypothetical protein C8Q79DRAFT_939843 [Trametes meyenii]|nr:hypothetical protein C8Q79DRAFT_939843 [Trametes meyenii]